MKDCGFEVERIDLRNAYELGRRIAERAKSVSQ